MPRSPAKRAQRPVSRPDAARACPPLDPADRIGGHLGVISDFVAAVREGTEPETVGHDNIRSLAMALGAIESAEAGRRIEIVI